MNDTEYKIQLVIDAQNQASQEITKLQNQIKELQGSVSSTNETASKALSSIKWMLWKITTAAIVAGIVKIGQASIQAAAEIEPIRNSFERLSETAGIASDEMLAAMRKASAWTVSDMWLMEAANKAYSLWVVSNTEEMTTLMEIARLKGQAMWRTMNEALDDIVTWLWRWSAMILDNLWIVVNQTEAQEKYAASLWKTVEQLTAAERKQALINEVVSQWKVELEQAWPIAETFADKQAKMTAQRENMKVMIWESLTPAIWELYDKASERLDAHQEEIRAAIETIWDLISSVVEVVSEAAELIWGIIWDICDIFQEWVSNNMQANEEWLSAMAWNWTDLFYIISQVINFIQWIFEVGIWYIRGLRDWLKEWVNWIINDIAIICSGWVDWIKEVFRNMWNDVLTYFKKLINWVASMWNKLVDFWNDVFWTSRWHRNPVNVEEIWEMKSWLWKMLEWIYITPVKEAAKAWENALNNMINTYWERLEKLYITTNDLSKKTTSNLSNLWNIWWSTSSSSKSWKSSSESKANAELIKEMNEYAKQTKKMQKDKYQALDKEAEYWLKNQQKKIEELNDTYQEAFDAIQKNIDSTAKNIQNLENEISSLQNTLANLWKEQTTSIAKEYVTAKKWLEELEEQYAWLKDVANSVSREDLKWVGWIWKYDVDLIKKYKDYQDELSSAYEWLNAQERKEMDEQIAYQERYWSLNNVEKIKEDYRIRKEEVQAELNEKINALNIEQETLRQYKAEQQKLQDEWIARINEEVAKRENVSKLKQEFEKKYMDILEIDHTRQVQMTNQLVDQWNAVYRAKMRAMSAGSSWSRASGWPVYQGNAYLVWEAWPEMFVPSTNWRIVNNSDLNKGWDWAVEVNINMWNITIANWTDEEAFFEKMEDRLTRSLILYKKWIRA